MPKVSIQNIFGGIAPSRYLVGAAQYLEAIGIDPDLPISDAVGDKATSGVIRPSGYATFSGANVTGNVIAIITTPKNANIYVVTKNGRLISYDSAFGTETLIGTVAGGNAEGAAYYNNYIYIFGTGASVDDVSRYGPLSTTPTLVDNVWKGATLGTKTALIDTTYPAFRGSGTYPKHWAHEHVDGKLYFCDFDSTSGTAANRGRGLIHFIKTTYTSAEGDTNSGSTYNALDLPLGYMPTDIESYGNRLAILISQSTSSVTAQGKSALLLWDTVSSSYDTVIPLDDPLATALLNVNGELYVFSGSISTGSDASNGFRISRYIGGQSFQQVYFSDTGCPPLAGAVESYGDKIAFGGFQQIPTTTGASPEYFATVMALGSKNNRFTRGVHSIVNSKATGSATDGLVTAIKRVQQGSNAYPKFAVAWRDATTFGVDNQSTTYGTTVFRSQMFNINKPFTIRSIRFGLGKAIAASMTITPKLFLDDFSRSSVEGLTVINNTNYANSERNIVYYPNVSGSNNFVLEFRCTGTVLLPILLPVEIEFELLDNA